jgi:hypothetical protein
MALMGFVMFAPPVPASAQSTGSAGGALCLSLMLVAAHEMASHCGDTTDVAAEQRYRDVQMALRTFIIESDPALKGSADPQRPFSQNEQAMRERYSAMDRSICEKPEHANMKRVLETFTSVEFLAKLRETMKTWSNDKSAVGCL